MNEITQEDVEARLLYQSESHVSKRYSSADRSPQTQQLQGSPPQVRADEVETGRDGPTSLVVTMPDQVEGPFRRADDANPAARDVEHLERGTRRGRGSQGDSHMSRCRIRPEPE